MSATEHKLEKKSDVIDPVEYKNTDVLNKLGKIPPNLVTDLKRFCSDYERYEKSEDDEVVRSKLFEMLTIQLEQILNKILCSTLGEETNIIDPLPFHVRHAKEYASAIEKKYENKTGCLEELNGQAVNLAVIVETCKSARFSPPSRVESDENVRAMFNRLVERFTPKWTETASSATYSSALSELEDVQRRMYKCLDVDETKASSAIKKMVLTDLNIPAPDEPEYILECMKGKGVGMPIDRIIKNYE